MCKEIAFHLPRLIFFWIHFMKSVIYLCMENRCNYWYNLWSMKIKNDYKCITHIIFLTLWMLVINKQNRVSNATFTFEGFSSPSLNLIFYKHHFNQYSQRSVVRIPLSTQIILTYTKYTVLNAIEEAGKDINTIKQATN